MEMLIIVLSIIAIISSLVSIALHLIIMPDKIKAWRHARKIMKTLKEVDSGKTGKGLDEFLNEL